MPLAWVVLFMACTPDADPPAPSADTSTDTGSAEDTSPDSAQPGTALDVENVEMEECTGDTGGPFCSGERKDLTAVDNGPSGGVKVEDIGVYVGCGMVKVSARALAPVVTVAYDESDGSDCSCLHILRYRLHGLPAGTWTIDAREHHGEVTVAEVDSGTP